jgi:hypothetical protein
MVALTGAIVCICMTAMAAAVGNDSQTYSYAEIQVPLYQEGALSAPSPLARMQTMGTMQTDSGQARDGVLQGLVDMSDNIVLEDYGLTVDDLQYLFADIVNSNPQLFYVSSGFKYSWYPDSGIIAALNPEYIGSKPEIAAQKREYEYAVNRALALVPLGCTDAEKVLAVNDYIAASCEYDSAAADAGDGFTHSYSSYGALVNGVAVCQGYALAFIDLMNRLNVNTLMVTSVDMDHAWNLVSLNGSWYHVDTTWNDPVPDMLGYVEHKYLLLSDSAIGSAEPTHYGWDRSATPYANDTAYDAFFWRNVETQFIPRGGSWYYIEHAAASRDEGQDYDTYNLWAYNFSNDTQAEIYTIATEEIGEGPFGALALAGYGEHLYYTAYYSIYRIKFDGTENELFHDARQDVEFTTYEKIYDMAVRGRYLIYRTRTSRNSPTVKDMSIELSELLFADVNGDDAITIADVTLIYQHVRGKIALTGDALLAADVNGIGGVTIADVTLVYQYVRGKITSFL